MEGKNSKLMLEIMKDDSMLSKVMNYVSMKKDEQKFFKIIRYSTGKLDMIDTRKYKIPEAAKVKA